MRVLARHLLRCTGHAEICSIHSQSSRTTENSGSGQYFCRLPEQARYLGKPAEVMRRKLDRTSGPPWWSYEHNPSAQISQIVFLFGICYEVRWIVSFQFRVSVAPWRVTHSLTTRFGRVNPWRQWAYEPTRDLRHAPIPWCLGDRTLGRAVL